MIVLSAGDSWREEREDRVSAGWKLEGLLVPGSLGLICLSGKSYVNDVRIHEKYKMAVEMLRASWVRC